MAIGPGTRVGPYEIRSLLGAGGMGEVFLAHDARLGRDVAVKILPARFADDADRMRRFEVEARAAGQLNHPNILAIFDIGAEAGQPYVVSERLEGETLRGRLSRGAIPEREAVEIARQVARGLVAAHARGIVHRDLKPENLFLTRDGHVKILDFGLAKLTRDEASSAETQVATAFATEPGLVVGTVQYMAPEQVKGQPADHRVDLFAFGVVLYEMLSGASPFNRASSAESMSAVLHDAPAPLDEAKPGSSPALARIVEHCLGKSPEQRFQSGRDLLFVLESVGSRSSSELTKAPAIEPRARSRRTALRWVLEAGALAAALALGWRLGRTPAVGSDAPAFARVTRIVATDRNEFSPVLSPDVKWIAYVSDGGDHIGVFVKFLSGGETADLTAGSENLEVARSSDIGGLDISPDGTQIMFTAGPHGAQPSMMSAYVIGAPLGGTPRKLIDRGISARWSPDGTKLAYVVAGGGAGDALAVSDANGANQRQILPAAGGVHAHWPAWSADGQFVYFIKSTSSMNGEPAEIFRVAAAGGNAEPVVTTTRRALFPWPSRDGAGLLYSANPTSAELAVWWKPFGGNAVRVTTGVGDYAEARLSADRRMMAAAVYQFRRSLATLATEATAPIVPTRITEGWSGDYDPAVSPGGDRMAFSSSRDGNRHIWTARLDGSDLRQVTSGLAIDERPAWSPDGASIAFVSSRGEAGGIWVVGADGSALRKVISARVIDTVTWSPDGRELVFAAPNGEVASLFRVPAVGGASVRLVTAAGATAPHWSAVRNLIAYIEYTPPTPTTPLQSRLAFVTPDGQGVVPGWTESPRLANGIAAWSPDGRSVATLSDPGGIESTVWIYDMHGDGPPRRLIRLANNQRPRGISWLPDNRRVMIGLAERTSDIVLFDQGSL